MKERAEKDAKDAWASAQARQREQEKLLEDLKAELERMIEDRKRRREEYSLKLASGEMKITDQSGANRFIERLKEKEIVMTLSAEARDLLAEKGFDPAYGARPMRRAVERFLEDPLAEALLRGTVKTGDIVQVVRKEGSEELVFESSRPDGEPQPDVATVGAE
jgi:ATP-dependent Clp protease ATP-binding subunit ClpC